MLPPQAARLLRSFSSAGADTDFLENVNSRASEHRELRHSGKMWRKGYCKHPHLSSHVLTTTLITDAPFSSAPAT